MQKFSDTAKKYSSKRNMRLKNKSTKLNFNLDNILVTYFCRYALSDNLNITRKNLITLHEILKNMDTNKFKENKDITNKYLFCLSVLEAKLYKSLTDKALIIHDAFGLCGEKVQVDVNEVSQELSNTDVEWVENCIVNCSNFMYINNDIVDLESACIDYMNAPINERENSIGNIKNLIYIMSRKLKENELQQETVRSTIDMTNVANVVTDIYNEIEQGTVQLKTGMQGLNSMLAGGFRGSRVYGLFSPPAGGKTTTMINLAYQIKECNKDYICKDKTKIPCIVFLTMENAAEDVLRTLYNVACQDTRDFDQISKSELLARLNAVLAPTPDDPINIVIKYKPMNSINTSYLETLTCDLEESGYEVICVFQDYLKRITPELRTGEPRIDYAQIINDFRTYAIARNIPVITASQINRQGISNIDDSHHCLVEKINRANIGESAGIDENLDCTILMVPEMDDHLNWYMGMKCTKHRYAVDQTFVAKFYQPYDINNRARMIVDVYDEDPAYTLSLADGRPDWERNTAVIHEAKLDGIHRAYTYSDEKSIIQEAKEYEEKQKKESANQGFAAIRHIKLEEEAVPKEKTLSEIFKGKEVYTSKMEDEKLKSIKESNKLLDADKEYQAKCHAMFEGLPEIKNGIKYVVAKAATRFAELRYDIGVKNVAYRIKNVVYRDHVKS